MRTMDLKNIIILDIETESSKTSRLFEFLRKEGFDWDWEENVRGDENERDN